MTHYRAWALALLIAAPLVAFAQTYWGINGSWSAPASTASTASIGGSALLVGACTSGTANVTGATTSMVAVASPVTAQPNGVQWQAYVSSAGIVTVNVCAIVAITPTSSVYNVRVIP